MKKKPREYISKYKKTGNSVLNKSGHHSVAAISYSIEAEYTVQFKEDKKEVVTSCIDANITISDCFKSVGLNFDIYDEKDAKNALAKIKKLKENIEKFDIQLKEALAHLEEKEKLFGKKKIEKSKRGNKTISLKEAIKLSNENKGKTKG